MQELDLSGNQLTSVPEALGQLSQLQRLDLSSNRLTSVPEALGQLSQLQRLDLSSNRLTSVPEALGQLSQLQQLYLSDNQLTSVPEALGQLSQLQVLDLHGNPALELPAEVLGPTWDQVGRKGKTPARPAKILDYYFRTRGGRRSLNEAKLILVGRGGVGKTSLVNRLIYDTFNKDEKKTEGLRIVPWNLLLKGTEKVRLNVWDFGGQEIMHATHQFFLTQRSLYLLVLNGREGGEMADAEYWLKLIESLGAESPVLVVLNKIKEHPFDLNRRGLQQKYPAVRDFIRTDCEDRTGIDELRTAIERETGRLEHLRDPFPASWFAIKDRLAGMVENYLTFDQYREICAASGEKEAKAQELLASYLHVLGIALNYKDDPRLRDTHVLKPHWVTNGIYTILNAPKLAVQKGMLSVTDLAEILDVQEYPWKMHTFLFDLMKKFELCFSFPDDDSLYLIPELLDVEEPETTREFRPEECLNFQYHYPILPEGLLPRFIVRTHTMSEGLPRWRSGVILQFEDCRALVKADFMDRKVQVLIAGPAGNRRRLLALVRSDFERIHASIEKLLPDEMVSVPGRPQLVIPYRKLAVLEQKGQTTLMEVFGDEVIELNIAALLNGVDLTTTLRRRGERDMFERPLRLFYSYSHKDEGLRNQLDTHLKLLQRRGLIASWHVRVIGSDERWADQVDENSERADIILLLVSADFLASDYCYGREVTRALERHSAGEAIVIPVILRNVNWSRAPFAKLQALPKDARAVTLWVDRDSAWQNVSERIENAVEFARRGRARPRKRTLRVSQIEITNIRCFDHLKLDFTSGGEHPAQFSLIFGENGVGKTTLLRSIALGLCHETKSAALVERLRVGLLRNNKTTASIETRLVDPESRKGWTVRTEFSISKKKGTPTLRRTTPPDFPSNAVFVCGYGAGRRVMGVGDPSVAYEIDDAVLSLFDYQASLQNPELIIRRIESGKGSLNEILLKIDAALSLPLGSTTVDSKGIQIRGPWGDFITAGALGDGYQATLAWLVDFLGSQALFDTECPLTDISGVVLLDELEQHLHPRWQREIVQQLVQQFPNVQFITTSHSPVCAGGLADLEEGNGRLIVLQNVGKAVSAKDVPVPAGMRYDQIMTSEVFGLPIARDMTTAELIEELRESHDEPGYPPGQSPRFTQAMEQLRNRSVTAAEDEQARQIQRDLAIAMDEIRKMMNAGKPAPG